MRIQRATQLLVLAATVAIAVGATVYPGRDHARSEPAGERLPSPMLLKRLAEALDGYRMGQRVYIVASWSVPNHVIGVYGSKDTADAVSRSAADLGVFGPYRAPLERAMTAPTSQNEASTDLFVGGCQHDGRTSDWICGGDTTMARRSLPLGDIVSMTVTVKTTKGTYTQTLRKGTDAVFWSLPAVDKFALPYYVHTLGIERAAQMRAELVKKLGLK